MGNHQAYNEVSDAIRTNIWYEFKRQRITIPFPTRTLHVQRRRHQSVPEGHAEAQAILRGEPLFDCLNDAQLDNVLAQRAHPSLRAGRTRDRGRRRGQFDVRHAARHGARFGLAKRHGNPRWAYCGRAIVSAKCRCSPANRARRPFARREIAKCWRSSRRPWPRCCAIPPMPDPLSELLAKRKLEGEGIVKDAAQPHDQGSKEREYRASFLERLRAVFEL